MIRLFLSAIAGTLLFHSTCYSQDFAEFPISEPLLQFQETLLWFDADNDDQLELLIAGALQPTRILKVSGDDVIEWSSNLPTLHNAMASTADFNNDGLMDLVLSGNTSGDGTFIPLTNIYFNNGDGTFTPSENAKLLGLLNGSIANADYDLDGDVDILLSGLDRQSAPQTVLFTNNGDGSFSEYTAFTFAPSANGTVSWGDYDRDSDPDIIITANHSGFQHQTIVNKVYTNDGGHFTEATILLPTLMGNSTWVDVNNDGFLDIFQSGVLITEVGPGKNYSDKSMVFINSQDGKFVKLSTPDFENLNLQSFGWADFDNDGDKDLVASEFFTNNVLFFSNEGGTFIRDTTVEFDKLPVVSVGDYNNDKNAEFALSGYSLHSTNTLVIYKNTNPTVNNQPSKPNNVVVAQSDARLATIKWEASTDSETPKEAIKYMLRLGSSSGADDVFASQTNGSGAIKNPASIITFYDSIPLKNLPDGAYYGAVQAVDQSNRVSEFSEEFSFIISNADFTTLPRPTLLSGSQTPYDYYSLRWKDESSNEDNFIIERSANNESNYNLLATLQKNSTSYLDTTVNYGTKYYYRIKAQNALSSSDYSEPHETDLIKKDVFRRKAFPLLSNESNASTSVNWVHINDDSHIDIFFTGSDIQKMFEGSTNGKYERILSTGPSTLHQQSRTATWGDYNNDGLPDVFIATSSNNHLYRNDGNGTFSEVLEEPFLSDLSDTNSASWADFDNDGFVDLLALSYGTPVNLYRNNRLGGFEKVSGGDLTENLDSHSMASWCDFDNDGFQDVLLLVYGGQNVLFKNLKNGQFKKVESFESSYSMAVSASWGDYDHDGDFDLCIFHNSNNIAPDFFINNGDGTLSRTTNAITASHLLANSSSWSDFDNDGNIDLITVGSSGVKIFKNDGHGDFSIIDLKNDEQHIGYLVGVATGDANADGFLDISVAAYAADNPIYENHGNNNHWIAFNLSGTKTNKSAIGAKVRILANNQWQTDFVTSLSGNGGQNSMTVEFGLGSASVVDSVVIEWPDHGYQLLANIDADQFVHIVEPEFPKTPQLTELLYNKVTYVANIQWSDLSTNENGFVIEKAFGSEMHFKKISTVEENQTFFSEEITTDGDTVFYRVAALNTEGRSPYSGIMKHYIPLRHPTGLLATQDENTVNLQWTDAAINESGYRIYRKISETEFEVVSTLEKNSTQFSDIDLPELTTISYYVTVYNALYAGTSSDTISIRTEMNAPDLTEITTVQNKPMLSWTDFSEVESGYLVERALEDENPPVFEIVATLPENTQNFQDENALELSSLLYRVRAVRDTDSSMYSISKPATTTINPPTNLSATISENHIELEWKDNSLIETGYVIEKEFAGGTFEPIDTVTSNTIIFHEANVQQSKSKYRVAAIAGASKSLYSNVAEVIITSTADQQIESITCMPNPTSDIISIGNLNGKFNKLTVVSSTGSRQIVLDITNAKDVGLSLEKFLPGIYLIILNGNDLTVFKRIIRE